MERKFHFKNLIQFNSTFFHEQTDIRGTFRINEYLCFNTSYISLNNNPRCLFKNWNPRRNAYLKGTVT